MDISLTPELQKFVENEVKTGAYPSVSDVVRAGLRRLQEDREIRLPQMPSSLEALEADLLESADRLDRGEGVDIETVFTRLHERIKTARRNG